MLVAVDVDVKLVVVWLLVLDVTVRVVSLTVLEVVV